MFKSLVKSSRIACLVKFSSRGKSSKFLSSPVKTSYDQSRLPIPTKIDEDTVKLLEKLSLVGFESEKAIKIVEDAIQFADQIFDVNTDKVKPLVTVLENENLHLRPDIVKKDVTRQELLSHSKVTEANYYISPTGVVSDDTKEKLYERKEIEVKL